MIREAVISDLDQALTLFQEGYEETPFSEMEFDRTHVVRWFANVTTFKDKFFCRIVEEENEIVGILIGVIDKNFWGIPTAQTLVSYARKDTHKLIRQFIEWSKEKGAKQVTVQTVPGKERYEQLIDKMGFFRSGTLYTKEI